MSLSNFLKIIFNIVFIFMSVSSKWSVFLRFSTKTPNEPPISPVLAISYANLILLNLITRTILGEGYRSISPSLCRFLNSPFYPVLLRPKYFPQHFILKHPQHTSPPPFMEQPSFTPIQNNRQNYISGYLFIYIFA